MKTIEIVDVTRTEKSEEPIGNSVLALYETGWKDYLNRKNYSKDINKMCSDCQKDQIRKHGRITIKCTGPRNISRVPEDVIALMSESELETIKQTVDPYYWADKNIDIFQRDNTKRLFVPRWYQEMQLACSASKKAIRCGRRIGKTFGISLDIVNRLIQNSNYQILVVTPFLSQAKELSDTVRKLIRAINPEIGSWDTLVERSVTSPYQEIKLKNGSTLKAFTAGNDNANAVRGQGAHLIVVDEADFLSQEAFDSLMAILMDKPNTEIICTSTPMGENIMYKLSQSKDYKEFHFPSFVLPHYSDDMDSEFRERFSTLGFVQEIIAEFGIDDSAVFQSDFVNNAIATNAGVLPSDVLANRHKYTLALGCDWNSDKVGTRICVLAYSKESKKFFIANMSNVRKEGWTQVAAIQKIIELNRQYEPDYIYVDEGFGEANVQQLKLVAVNNYGKLPKNHPDLKLANVVPVNFSSTLELRDILTGEIRKKYFKNFIVETTKRALEKGMISLSNNLSVDIANQMKTYSVKSRQANGREIYEAKDPSIGDHDLDAFMIALTAIYMNQEQVLDARVMTDNTILPLEKRGSETYNQEAKIEKRRYSEDDNYSPRRRLPDGIKRRSDITGRSPYSRGMFNRSGKTSIVGYSSYRINMTTYR